jgi:hypothetical protein
LVDHGQETATITGRLYSMDLKDICIAAGEVGKSIDLSGCSYGPSHTVANHILIEPLSHYYFLAGFCKFIEAKNILEIGTYYGGSICSINRAVQAENIVTIDPETHNDLPENIKRIQGRGEDRSTYTGLRKLFNGNLDLVFIDGVHLFNNTKKYFENVKPLRPRFVIFDDIRLNSDMEKLWRHLSVRYNSYDCSEESGREKNCGLGVVKLR